MSHAPTNADVASLAPPASPAAASPVLAVPAAARWSSVGEDELGPRGRRLLTGGVLAAHVLGGWALLQVDAVRQAVVHAAPVMISMLAPAQAPTPPPPPRPPAPPRKPAPAPTPLIAAAPSPTPASPAFVAPEPVPVPAVVDVAPPTPAQAPVPAPPAVAPPAPKMIAPGSVRYLVEPRMSVPLMSRRLKESGVVYLRIVVDAKGLLQTATVSRSSGFARLDEQALHDIRSARFVPQTENGQPIEWQTTAPLSYEVN